MISNVLKISSLGSTGLQVAKHRHLKTRICGVTQCYLQQKRNSHGLHINRGYLVNPTYGVQQNKILNTSLQFSYVSISPHIPLCVINVQQKRFAHKNPNVEYCEPKKKSRSGLYLAGAVVLFSSVIGYAKYDNEFRQKLNDLIPGSTDFIGVIFQEDKTYLERISEALDKVKDRIVDTINNTFGSNVKKGDDGKPKSSKALPPCDEEKKPYKPPRSAFKPLLGEETSKKEDVKFTERRSLTPPKPPEKEPTIVQEAIERPKPVTSEAEPEQTPEHSETHPQTLVELEETIGNHAQIAIKNYNEAICVLRDHAEEVYKLVETSVEKVDPKVWPQIKAKSLEKEKLVAEAELNAKVAEKSIDKLKHSLNNPRLQAPDDMKERAKKNMQKVLSDVAEARKAFEKEKARASVTEKYWSKVEEARKHFSEELEILFPNVRLSEKQLKLAEGEIDLFILYAFQNILYYQKEVVKLETVGELRIKQALEQSKMGDPELVKSAVQAEIDKQKRKIQEDFQKRTLELKSECEADIRNQMKRQADAHSDHLNEVIALKEKEVERRLERKVEDKILDERVKFKEELAGMVARLKGFDEAVKRRADQDKYAQQSQMLWSACQTLVATLKNSDVNQPWEKQLKPLKDEVNAISKAGEKDELVGLVVKSIPEEALERGIYSEDALRERFLNVERVASIVALVPDDGASLPLILLSYVQNLFIIKNPLPIPAYELANEPFDPSSLNTLDILQRARFWMDRGDVALTLKYMNLLQGGARTVAKDWIKEAQLMLETKQAANVLLTHASASGLVYS